MRYVQFEILLFISLKKIRRKVRFEAIGVLISLKKMCTYIIQDGKQGKWVPHPI